MQKSVCFIPVFVFYCTFESVAFDAPSKHKKSHKGRIFYMYLWSGGRTCGACSSRQIKADIRLRFFGINFVDPHIPKSTCKISLLRIPFLCFILTHFWDDSVDPILSQSQHKISLFSHPVFCVLCCTFESVAFDVRNKKNPLSRIFNVFAVRGDC